MNRTKRALLAVTMAVVLNLVGIVLLTALSVAGDDPEPEPEPERTVEAPEIRSLPEPRPRRDRPRRQSDSVVENTIAGVAASQLPTFSTLDVPNAVPVAVDPAVQESLDTLFSDLSRRPQGSAVPEALFEGSGRGSDEGSGRGAPTPPGPAVDATEVDEAPTVRQRVSMRYPIDAERDGITGYVVLRGLVERDGRVSRVEILDSNPSGVFDQAAKSAFAKWRFQPGRDGGKPVRVWVRKRLEFRLR